MKKAIIIGATSGIGKALTQILVKNNYHVGITGRRNSKLEQLKSENPKQYETSCFDCTAMNNAEKLTELTERLGGLDLLVLSSGIGHLNDDLDFELEDETNQLNVVAFTEIATWAFRYFQHKGVGHLVVISSIAGLRGSRLVPAYNASKAYQINYLEGLRQKSTKLKLPITITDIQPGFVDTAMAKGEGQFWVATKEKAAKQVFNHIKRKRNVAYVTNRWRLIAMLFKVLPNWIWYRM